MHFKEDVGLQVNIRPITNRSEFVQTFAAEILAFHREKTLRFSFLQRGFKTEAEALEWVGKMSGPIEELVKLA